MLSDDALMREVAHMNAVLIRKSRRRDGFGELGVLVILSGHEEAMAEGFATRLMSQVELADAIGIRPQSIGPLLTSLEGSGCIRRFVWERDRRTHLVELTDLGRERARGVRDEQRAFAAEVFSALSADEKRAFAAAIIKLNAWLNRSLTL